MRKRKLVFLASFLPTLVLAYAIVAQVVVIGAAMVVVVIWSARLGSRQLPVHP